MIIVNIINEKIVLMQSLYIKFLDNLKEKKNIYI